MDIGRQYNQLNNVVIASQLADFSRHVALVQDVIIGMMEGVGQGAVNVAHMAMHPIETVQHMAQGAATALKGLFYAVLEQQEIEFALESGQLDVADARIHAVQEKFNRVQTVIKDKLSQMSARDIGREITSLGTEFYLQGKLLGAIGEFFTYAQEQLPKIAESAATLLQDERALLSTAEGIPVHIADEALSAMKTESQLHKMDKVSQSSSKIGSGISKSIEKNTKPSFLDKLRQAIINREKRMTSDDIKLLGGRSEVFETLRKVDQKTGRIKFNGSSQGGIEKARRILESVKNNFSSRKLIDQGIESLKNGGERVFYRFEDGSHIQFRNLGKSGHPKVDIVDILNNIEEKITFK